MRTEDGYIIYKCLNGEPEAFGLLVDKYKAAIYALVYAKLRNFHDAEDVAQETFIRAFENLHKLRRWESLASWLYRIASNVCKQWIKVNSRRPDQHFLEDSDPDAISELSINSHRHDSTFKLIHEAIDSLPEIHRQVLSLHYLGGMTSIEIAKFSGISPAAVRKRLTRARSQLREEILVTLNTVFEKQKLSASFTLRITESVRHINPSPRPTKLPWGISIAAGMMLAILGLGTLTNSADNTGHYANLPAAGTMESTDTGEILVDIIELNANEYLGNGVPLGAGEFRLLSPHTASPGTDWMPNFSPDGSMIAYVSSPDVIEHVSDDSQNLYTIPVDGGSPNKLVTYNGADGYRPRYSPDGRFILYTSSANSQGLGIWAVDCDNSDSVKVYDSYANDYEASWNPDGTEIVFTSEQGSSHPSGQTIWVASTDGTDLRQVTNGNYGDHDPCWSPDGNTIAFCSGLRHDNSKLTEIYTIPAIGGTPVNITNTPHWHELEPAYSPDGQWLAFISDRGEQWGLWAMPASGGSQILLAEGYIHHPCWSPDGTQIAFEWSPNQWSPTHGAAYDRDIWVISDLPIYPKSIEINVGPLPDDVNSTGFISVAVLSTSIADGEMVNFDATAIDMASIKFGPFKAPPINSVARDIDNDGDLDMYLHFRLKEVGISHNDSELHLTGRTVYKQFIVGKAKILASDRNGNTDAI